MSLKPLLAALLVLAASSLVPLAAQEGDGQQPQEDPRISQPVEQLELELQPKTKAELEEVLSTWQGILQAKVQQISDVKLEIMRARNADADQPAGDPTQLQDRVSTLQAQRTSILDRLGAVVKAYEAKGGDAEEVKAYADAVAGSVADDIAEQAFDPAALWQTVKNWAISPEGGLRLAKNIGMFILILLAFKILGSIAGKLVDRALTAFRKTPDLLRKFMVNSVRKVTFFIGIVMAISALEIDITPFVAAIGGAAFVIGFALQGTLSNFAAGVMILLYRPYEIGDAVNVAGVAGKVEAMTLVSTTIATFDNQEVIVPNSSIWGNVITNITGKPTRRVDMKFGISYGDDIDQAARILEEIVTAHPKVLKDPAPVIKMSELADSSVNFVVRPWSKTSDYWEVYWDVHREVKKRFDAEGVSIPFPQRDVHIFQEALPAPDDKKAKATA